MKKIFIYLQFIMLPIITFGQDIIIDFAGTGETTEITNVEVVNLSNCTSIEVISGNSLNLTTGEITGVEEFKNLTNNSIIAYPNPFENSTNIEFYVNQNDYVNVNICDVTGKTVANFSKEMTKGFHSFDFTANNFGMYFINVSGTNFVQTSKIICLSNNTQQAQLFYKEQVVDNITEKSCKNGNSKDFSFTVGDMLKLKGISGDYDYATVMIVEPTTSGTYTFNFVACQDADENNYAVVEIGEQTWMAQNIKTTSYTNGDDIPYVTDDEEWEALEDNTGKAYCFYNNDENSIYGALYTYAAAINFSNSKTNVQGVCPIGWHIPSDSEWTILTDELGGQNVAGEKLKSTCMGLWDTPNAVSTNETGFTALPGGYRNRNDASFAEEGNYGRWWSATQNSESQAWCRYLYYNWTKIVTSSTLKSYGFSVRCIKD